MNQKLDLIFLAGAYVPSQGSTVLVGCMKNAPHQQSTYHDSVDMGHMHRKLDIEKPSTMCQEIFILFVYYGENEYVAADMI